MPTATKKTARKSSSARSNGRSTPRSSRTDAIALLKADHQTVQKLFREYEKAEENFQEKRQIAFTVFQELGVHSDIEEKIFYPAGKDAEGELTELIPEGYEEHHVVATLMEEMKEASTEEAEAHGAWDDHEFDAKFNVMMENVEHHIQEEEGQMFPLMKKHLGSRSEELGRQMAERKQAMMASAGRKAGIAGR